MTGGPDIGPIDEAELEPVASAQALALVCTVPVWLPDPWPEEFGGPVYKCARRVWETGYVVSSKGGRGRIIVSCRSRDRIGAGPAEVSVQDMALPTTVRTDGRSYFFRVDPGDVSIDIRIVDASLERATKVVASLRRVDGAAGESG